jgi:EpsI family protein
VAAAGAAMLLAAGLASAIKPTERLADLSPKPALEEMIPKQFGDWEIDPTLVPVQASPDVLAALSRIYSETLSRTYRNPRTGDRIMLSIAYGREQRSDMAVHYPEVCYPAQGFDIRATRLGEVLTPHGAIPVRRLESVHGPRHEPITYWTTIGEHVSLGGVHKRLIELRYGLDGVIPDGLLFRVSSIDRDAQRAFEKQDEFIRTLMRALPAETRRQLAGAGQG